MEEWREMVRQKLRRQGLYSGMDSEKTWTEVSEKEGFLPDQGDPRVIPECNTFGHRHTSRGLRKHYKNSGLT